MDYTSLNKVTKKDAVPLPRIDDSLDTLQVKMWFCSLDLVSGYWQVSISPEVHAWQNSLRIKDYSNSNVNAIWPM